MAKGERFIEFNGVMMTTRERNELLKMEYIRGDEVEDLAEKYGMKESTIKEIRRKNKWVSARRQYKERAKQVSEKAVTQLYAGHKVSINIKYHLAWEKLMNIIQMALDDPEKYLMHENGNIRWGAVSLVTEVLQKAQAGQGEANGVISKEVEIQLEMQREKLDLVKGQMNEGGLEAEKVVNDNLIDSINSAANVVFKDFKKKSHKDIARKYRKQGSSK